MVKGAADAAAAPALTEDLQAEEEEDVHGVFQLIDHQRRGELTEAALAQALLSTSLLDEAQSRAMAARAVSDGKPLDVGVFRDCLQEAVNMTARAFLESSSGHRRAAAATPSIGSALLGVLEDLRKFYAAAREDYRLANMAKEMYRRMTSREEARRLRRIVSRQEGEQQGVQEAQMMQVLPPPLCLSEPCPLRPCPDAAPQLPAHRLRPSSLRRWSSTRHGPRT